MRKYTLYAVGEIALVVIGILIALSINTWNEERKDLEDAIKLTKKALEMTCPQNMYQSL